MGNIASEHNREISKVVLKNKHEKYKHNVKSTILKVEAIVRRKLNIP